MHWAIVIGVVILLFGAKRLPDAARSIGRSARILRAELHADAPQVVATTAGPVAAAAGPGVPASPEDQIPSATTAPERPPGD